MKSNTLKTAVLVFGITLCVSNSSFGQSENRDDRKQPPTFEQLMNYLVPLGRGSSLNKF